MATRRTICITGIDVDVFNTIRDRPDFHEELGRWVASALLSGVTIKEAANLAMYDIEIDTVKEEAIDQSDQA